LKQLSNTRVAIPEKDSSTKYQTMKAIQIHNYGGPEVLHYEDAPRPQPQAGEVLVRVTRPE